MAMMGRDDYTKAYSIMKSRKQKTLGVIYIEDITDKQFWQNIAVHHEVKLYSDAGKTITGKSKLLQICSANQLIAIDSDFDVLCPNHRDESILLSEKQQYILQTYAHGRENITFSPNYLHQILENKFKLYIDNHPNPILSIFEKLSEIWFESYQKFLFLHNQKNTNFTHDDWIKAISLQNQESKMIALSQDFSAYQERMLVLNQKLNQYIENQNDFMMFCEHLVEKGFIQNNVWAFIRCHDFENKFVEPILKEIIKVRQNKELGDVEKQYSPNEISSRKQEIANYFKEINSLKTVLYHYFYDVYFPNLKHNDYFLQKIAADYQRVIA
ncbi:hypothetical protein [Moraxella sp. ZY210820]|uniref:hypothetical protein n=1 Tax=unclassified Moraxella TaxID=2685852 RepID=UPI0027301F7C|nr:hypothetical protein [Moraxella sp. ZY210820]WLF84201.1 DUF4435 domain-containing protein [Moraxella sp. ZY210820]